MSDFTDKAGRTICFAPLKREHEPAVLAMIERSFNFSEQDKAHLGQEIPELCFDTYFHRHSPDPERQHRDKKWREATNNKPESLQYYVALDGKKPVGVCGVYNAVPGYTKRIGATVECPLLENDKTFWLGWFAVDADYQHQGIGTQLLKRSVQEAVRRAGESVDQCRYAVYADKGAIPFYMRMGMNPAAHIEGGDAIMSAPLPLVARKLGIELPRHLERFHRAGIESLGR